MIKIENINHIERLADYIPKDTLPLFIQLFTENKFTIKIKKPRLTKLGDYRVYPDGRRIISVNSNLNPYSFAVTLLHEIAHHIVSKEHGRRIQAHGKIWKSKFSFLLGYFLKYDLPADIKHAIKVYMKNPKAASCSDSSLVRTLSRHNEETQGFTHLESLKEGDVFILRNGRKFIKGEHRRTRVKCKEFVSGRYYSISVVAEVKLVPYQKSLFDSPADLFKNT